MRRFFSFLSGIRGEINSIQWPSKSEFGVSIMGVIIVGIVFIVVLFILDTTIFWGIGKILKYAIAS